MPDPVQIIARAKLSAQERETEALVAFEEVWASVTVADLMKNPTAILEEVRRHVVNAVLPQLQRVVRIEATAQADLLEGPARPREAVAAASSPVNVMWEIFVRCSQRAGRNLTERLRDELQSMSAFGMSRKAMREKLIVDRNDNGRLFGAYRNEWRRCIRSLFRRVASIVSVKAAERVARAA